MKNEEPSTFSDCLKEMQKKCSHPEVEEFNGESGVVTLCMCCGKVLSMDSLAQTRLEGI